MHEFKLHFTLTSLSFGCCDMDIGSIHCIDFQCSFRNDE